MNRLNKIFIFVIGAGIVISGYYWWQSGLKNKTINKDGQNNTVKKENIIKTSSHNSEGKSLHSFFNQKEDYLEAFASCDKMQRINFTSSPRVGIVSHHFLAKNSIACFFDNFPNKNKITTIILIGPDHFHSFGEKQSLFFTTKTKWSTPFGNLLPEDKIINNLLKNKLVMENNPVFQTEHSIYTEIPFIKKAFPQAKVVPLIVKNNFDYTTFQDFGRKILAPLIKKNSLIIVSSDFTHHSTNKEARQIDRKSLEALENLSIKTLPKITSDCRACLALMSGCLLKENGKDNNKHFKLFANQNSTDFGGEDKNVTSYIFGYY